MNATSRPTDGSSSSERDGRHFLYMACIAGSEDNPMNAIHVASLDGKLDKALVPTASSAA